jgi:hypothetical protein
MVILSSHLRLRVLNGHHPAGFPPKHRLHLFWGGGPPVKIQGDSYRFVIAESEYGNQIAPSPINVKGNGIN